MDIEEYLDQLNKHWKMGFLFGIATGIIISAIAVSVTTVIFLL